MVELLLKLLLMLLLLFKLVLRMDEGCCGCGVPEVHFYFFFAHNVFQKRFLVAEKHHGNEFKSILGPIVGFRRHFQVAS